MPDTVYMTAARVAADVFGIPVDLITSRTKRRDVADARLLLYHLFRESGYSTAAIGRAMNRDHSTVVNGSGAIADAMETSPALRGAYEAIREGLNHDPIFGAGGDGGAFAHVVCLSPDTVDFLSAP